MLTLLLAAALTTADVACTTPNPGAGFVCVSGGWLPPNHPQLPPAAPEPTVDVPPINVPNPNGFRIGKQYQRDATGTRLYIAALTQVADGVLVYVAECLTVRTEDHCYFPHEARFILANASTSGWTELP